MRQVIHISDHKVDVIKHLRSQPNMSGYIVSLIEKDMENQLLTREEIIKLIQQYAGENSQAESMPVDSIMDILSID